MTAGFAGDLLATTRAGLLSFPCRFVHLGIIASMHELSIAQSVLDIVHQHVPAGEETRVRIIRVSIGTMAGVVADSLAFCFSAITQGTPFEGAVLEIAQVPLTARCNTCEANAPIDQTRFICPACGGSNLTVVSGREMQVREIELNDQTGNPP